MHGPLHMFDAHASCVRPHASTCWFQTNLGMKRKKRKRLVIIKKLDLGMVYPLHPPWVHNSTSFQQTFTSLDVTLIVTFARQIHDCSQPYARAYQFLHPCHGPARGLDHTKELLLQSMTKGNRLLTCRKSALKFQ
jgi:hypothetical protein